MRQRLSLPALNERTREFTNRLVYDAANPKLSVAQPKGLPVAQPQPAQLQAQELPSATPQVTTSFQPPVSQPPVSPDVLKALIAALKNPSR